MSMDRFLLCRPSGGLYDMLCQIGLCCEYADKWKRLVVVDTNHVSTRYFRDRFSNYFISQRRNLVLDISGFARRLENMPLLPAELSGRLHDYVAVAGEPCKSMVDQATGVPLTFDFSRDHEAPLLVHHTWGRTPYPLDALARMRLHPAIRHEVIGRLREIGPDFTGLHIRATDYQTDYRTGIAELRGKLAGPVFLATDNRAVLDFMRTECPEAEIYSFSRLPAHGQPLHDLKGRAEDVYESNRDAIADVMVLAHATRLNAFRLRPNPMGASLSGYSMLAFALRKHRGLLARIMSAARLDQPAPAM